MKNSDNLFAITSFKGKYDFLSNFYPVKINYEGIEYPSAEHAYQAAKFDDKETKIKFSKFNSPAQAKRESNKLKTKKGWDNIKKDVMYDILTIKFKNNELQDQLLSTGNAILIEGNWWADTFWGCMIKHENEYSGMNNLGEILMKIRHEYSPQNCLEY
jgi:ribA/ribD-fused uncharacterized protein